MFHITQDNIGVESSICMYQIFVRDSLVGFQIFAAGSAQIFQDSIESQRCRAIYYVVLFASHHWPQDCRLWEVQMKGNFWRN